MMRDKFMRLNWLIRKVQMANMAGNKIFDMTRGQGRILKTLKMKDGISTKDLSYILGIRITSLNETLAKLEKNGLVERRQSESDHRIMLIYLTEDGGNAVPDSESRSSFDYLSCLNDEEKETLESYIDRVIESLEQYLSQQSDDFSEKMKQMYEERTRVFRDYGYGWAKHFHRNDDPMGGFYTVEEVPEDDPKAEAEPVEAESENENTPSEE